MKTYYKNGVFTIELESKEEREAMIRQIGGIPTLSLVSSQFTYDMARELYKKLKEVDNK